MEEMYLSPDNYLLSKTVPASSIKRIIDWKSMNITKETLNERVKQKYGKLDEKCNFTDTRKFPDPDNQEEMDKFYVIELCIPYNPPPDDRDVFLYYDDLGPLCGSAGYIRLRDGYVWGQNAVIRS